MTDFKKNIEQITNSGVSKGVEKSRDRKSKPWLKYYSAPLARRILAILKEKRLSQIKLAATLDVQPQQINKIVKGQENLTLETIYKLSTALNFDLLTFPPYKYGRTGSKPISYNINIDSHTMEITKYVKDEISAILNKEGTDSSIGSLLNSDAKSITSFSKTNVE